MGHDVVVVGGQDGGECVHALDCLPWKWWERRAPRGSTESDHSMFGMHQPTLHHDADGLCTLCDLYGPVIVSLDTVFSPVSVRIDPY